MYNMVAVSVKGPVVVIKVLGFHKLLALKSKVEINKKNIKNVKIAEDNLRSPLIKLPGSRIPGLIAAGTFMEKNRKEFWDHVKKNKAIAIELENEKYTKIVVDVEHPEMVIQQLNNA
jgi:hypothetical protein